MPEQLYGDGDGTVNLRSLHICRKWPRVKEIILPHAEHLLIVRDARFISAVKEIIGWRPLNLVNNKSLRRSRKSVIQQRHLRVHYMRRRFVGLI
ncbi:unnamed protein product [Protopolystoma xenopodis]|uniref:Uncharacterized protein n=1 Tax=Protopolystoma xenopodis TaxID=117903 RepID=A0A3S5ALZ5_9PLAT|nr:unnamed protein product [Protopolystoma xenopodis]